MIRLLRGPYYTFVLTVYKLRSDESNAVSFLPAALAVDGSARQTTSSGTSGSMHWTTYGARTPPVYDPAFHHVWAPLCGNPFPFHPMSSWDMYGSAYVRPGVPHHGEAA